MTEVIGLTVAENLFLAAPPSERPKYGRMEPWAAERLREAELDIAAAAPTASLSLAQRQMLEVVQALLSKPKVLLLDEPTTALGHGDVERLHALIRDLAAQGIGIAYVSHRLPEVLERRPPSDGVARRRRPGHVRRRPRCRRPTWWH